MALFESPEQKYHQCQKVMCVQSEHQLSWQIKSN